MLTFGKPERTRSGLSNASSWMKMRDPKVGMPAKIKCILNKSIYAKDIPEHGVMQKYAKVSWQYSRDLADSFFGGLSIRRKKASECTKLH